VHGVIFNSLHDYLVAEHGREVAEAVFAGEPQYLLSEAYPDESLMHLVDVAASETAHDRDAILFGLGVFIGETTFVRLYPAFYAQMPSARQFLLNVEQKIHELVRTTIPHAGPPQLVVAPLGDDGVTIEYVSPRRLCVMLRGLTEGTARHFGQHAEMVETACMHRGDAACKVDVTFSDAATP
jgi:hypothetical protein